MFSCLLHQSVALVFKGGYQSISRRRRGGKVYLRLSWIEWKGWGGGGGWRMFGGRVCSFPACLFSLPPTLVNSHFLLGKRNSKGLD